MDERNANRTRNKYSGMGRNKGYSGEGYGQRHVDAEELATWFPKSGAIGKMRAGANHNGKSPSYVEIIWRRAISGPAGPDMEKKHGRPLPLARENVPPQDRPVGKWVNYQQRGAQDKERVTQLEKMLVMSLGHQQRLMGIKEKLAPKGRNAATKRAGGETSRVRNEPGAKRVGGETSLGRKEPWAKRVGGETRTNRNTDSTIGGARKGRSEL